MNEKAKINITDEIPVKAFLIYCYIVRINKGKAEYLLLQRENKYLQDTWQPVTGKVKHKETGVATALRELKEETGLTCESLYSANLVERFYEATTHVICLAPVFIAFIDPTAQVVLSKEHKTFQWVNVQAAANLLTFPQQIDTLEYIHKHFINKTPLQFLKIDL